MSRARQLYLYIHRQISGGTTVMGYDPPARFALIATFWSTQTSLYSCQQTRIPALNITEMTLWHYYPCLRRRFVSHPKLHN